MKLSSIPTCWECKKALECSDDDMMSTDVGQSCNSFKRLSRLEMLARTAIVSLAMLIMKYYLERPYKKLPGEKLENPPQGEKKS